MIRFSDPGDAALAALIEAQAQAAPSYDAVGASREGVAVPGFLPLRYEVELAGRFERAREGLARWAMMPGWIRALGEDAAEGVTVAVVSQQLGFYTVNCCRVVYVIDAPGRYGFGYGTLPAHVERGEERFLVEDLGQGRLRYAVTSFSRPAHPLVWLGFPYARAMQWRFARDSGRALAAWLASQGEGA